MLVIAALAGEVVPVNRMKKKEEKREQLAIKDFFDRILPGVLKFYSDHYICWGFLPLCVGHQGISTFHRGNRPFSDSWQTALMSPYGSTTAGGPCGTAPDHPKRQPAQRLRFGGDDIQEMVDAEHNLKDVKQLLTNLRTNGETLLHTAVFIELKAAGHG